MDRKRLDYLHEEIRRARRATWKGKEAEALAKALGRVGKAGGNHMMWRSEEFPHHRPFPIPRHGGSGDLIDRVRKTILDHLEEDAAAWEDRLTNEGTEQP